MFAPDKSLAYFVDSDEKPLGSQARALGYKRTFFRQTIDNYTSVFVYIDVSLFLSFSLFYAIISKVVV